jgi:hypothetical protein
MTKAYTHDKDEMWPEQKVGILSVAEHIKSLYALDTHGKGVSHEAYQTLQMLRQLINEEFVHTGKQITTQQLYDVLEEIIK